jgi:hypothetical protein
MNIYSDRYKIPFSYHKGWNTVQSIYEQIRKEKTKTLPKKVKAES